MSQRIHHAPHAIPMARELFHQGDLVEVQHLIHGLKGTSGNLTADRLYHVAAKLDEQLKSEGEIDGGLFDELDAAVKEIRGITEQLKALDRANASQST